MRLLVSRPVSWLAVLSIAFVWPSIVNAATVTVTTNSGQFAISERYGLSTTSQKVENFSSLSFTQSIAGFNSDLGTLTAVDVSVTGSAQLEVNATFTDNPNLLEALVYTAGVATVGNMSVSVQGLPLPFDTGDFRTGFDDTADGCEDFGIPGGVFLPGEKAECRVFFNFWTPSPPSVTKPFSLFVNFSDSLTLAAYTDTDIAVNMLQEITFATELLAGDRATMSGIFFTTSNLEITYTYTPVPIPAAVWLFGSALGLLGWLKRKAA